MMKITLENNAEALLSKVSLHELQNVFFLTIKVLILVSFKSKISTLKGYKVNF